MTQELMSLEEINQYESPFPYSERFLRLLATARAAHELSDELRKANKLIIDNNFTELMKINVLAELAKARDEERERCAKVAENTPTVLCQNGEFFSERVAKAIRALKD